MSRINRKRIKPRLLVLWGCTWIPVIAVCVMLMFVVGMSFMSSAEAGSLWAEGISAFHIVPRDFSIQSWKTVLYETPEYLLHFWNSVLLSIPVVAGSVFISALTGYGLALTSFRGKRLCIIVLVLLMLMPYQVTLSPNFILFNTMGLLGQRLTVILPSVFHPLGMVAMTYFMSGVPRKTLEAARLDGAGELVIFFKIAVPQAKGGIALLALYSFLDVWNLVEPVLVLIRDAVKYPMSIALRSFSNAQPGVIAACAVLLAVPALLVFAMLREALTEGMRIPGKE